MVDPSLNWTTLRGSENDDVADSKVFDWGPGFAPHDLPGDQSRSHAVAVDLYAPESTPKQRTG
jgi:hypothetical protein